MPVTFSDEQAVHDLVVGLAFLGTGGGAGRIEDALEMLSPILKAGQPLRLTSPDGLPDDAWTCAVASWGGRDPDTPPPPEELARYGLTRERFSFVERIAHAARELAVFKGVQLGAVVSMELGAAATVGAILTAAALGVPVLDGDYVGRAIPEAGQTKMDLLGVSPMPMSFVDRWGNVTIVKSAASALMADRLARQLSVAAYGKGVGGSGYLVQAAMTKQGIVRGSLHRAMAIGAALRADAAGGSDLVHLRKATGGRILFTGEAVRTAWAEDEPFVFRVFTYHLRGTGAFDGQSCRVWVKNEHHIAWCDERVVGTSPDVLVLLDADTKRPLSTRGEVDAGRTVILFGMAALDPIWHTPAGHALLGPRHFGFDLDPVPI
jgi:DUF917 family protein